MSATTLKIIAVICMTLDHLSTFLGAPLSLRYIGRIAAVIFFFCAAESAVHTHDRKKYLLRLYKMSLLMTVLSVVVPFILTGWFPDKSFLPPENNIFTELLPGHSGKHEAGSSAAEKAVTQFYPVSACDNSDLYGTDHVDR